MNYDRKYSMTKEENLFVAKRNMEARNSGQR